MFLKLLLITATGLLGGFLGALSGQGLPKILRRGVIPATLAILAYFVFHNPWVLTILTMYGVLSLGYGIPDVNDPKGSWLGGIVYDLVNEDATIANIYTKGILAILSSLCLLSIPILKMNPVSYLLGSITMLLGYVFFGGLTTKGLGFIKVGDKKLLVEEFLRYLILAASCAAIILF